MPFTEADCGGHDALGFIAVEKRSAAPFGLFMAVGVALNLAFRLWVGLVDPALPGLDNRHVHNRAAGFVKDEIGAGQLGVNLG